MAALDKPRRISRICIDFAGQRTANRIASALTLGIWDLDWQVCWLESLIFMVDSGHKGCRRSLLSSPIDWGKS